MCLANLVATSCFPPLIKFVNREMMFFTRNDGIYLATVSRTPNSLCLFYVSMYIVCSISKLCTVERVLVSVKVSHLLFLVAFNTWDRYRSNMAVSIVRARRR